MKLKITGRLYGTSNEIRKEIIAELDNDTAILIEHSESYTTLTLNGGTYYFEIATLKYEIMAD